MILLVKGKSKNVSRKKIKHATTFFTEKLLGKRLANNVEVVIKIKKMKKYNFGFCSPTVEDRSPRQFLIEINKKLSYEHAIQTLAHEIVHVKQFARNEFRILEGNEYKWFNKSVTMRDELYDYMPWEIEAREAEEWLVKRYEEEYGKEEDC